ncbi:DUF3012 domain-containing protein [Mariprofundus ferrooxydans]|uniref:DUF3012 domain-containing protein n=1 Tax=Mariprofundus ferrooxydans PV-1 TaxID=314345 RepID=Q0F230_9PROT|nr:DUF3012 domain-containing protein [Mariprofundus ferrooxydans]EAU55720.1 hypothetical protein SPV1_02192 [Mariprofundus ferrooxydans PV-1]KON47882.1 hypothetical protein AL013_05205 [Mariprofundus ferrooxydans]
MKIILTAIASMLLLFTLSACSPEPGTEAWCNKIKEKPKADWSSNDAATYAKYCVMGQYKK